MALTDAEKAAVREALGYPDVGADPHYALEGAMTALSAAGETRVRALLEQIETADAAMLGEHVTRGVTRVEDVEFANDGGRAMLYQRSQLVQRLARTLGVDVLDGGGTRNGPMLRG